MTPPAKAPRSSLGSADRCSGRIWNFMVPPMLLGGKLSAAASVPGGSQIAAASVSIGGSNRREQLRKRTSAGFAFTKVTTFAAAQAAFLP